MKKQLGILLLTAALAGCATTYQPTGATGGFKEMELKPDIWHVAFSGNGYTTVETVQTYWLYRCAELALEKGFDGFEVISHIQLVLPLSPEQFFADDAPIKPARSAGPVYTPIYIPSGNGARKPLLEADIRLLKNPISVAPPRVFDALELKTVLDPYVFGKKCSTDNVCPHVHEYLHPKGKFDKPAI